MADRNQRLAGNQPGDFYVDATCIDCGTCRWVAPGSFVEGDDVSLVGRQPADPAAIRRAEMALLACPVGAIGTETRHDLAAARAAFPETIDGPVHHCGYHAADSFGAASYLIVRPEGNVLVDSPRFTAPLVSRIEALGGIAMMVLTHRDDVADHQRFKDHFGCTRILHRADATASTRGVERLVAGSQPVRLADDLVLIPTPGHTRGSVCLLHADRHLFTGDHLAWSPSAGALRAFRGACWYDWPTLVRSLRALTAFRFAWVLPGHGHRVHLPEAAMAEALGACIAWAETA